MVTHRAVQAVFHHQALQALQVVQTVSHRQVEIALAQVVRMAIPRADLVLTLVDRREIKYLEQFNKNMLQTVDINTNMFAFLIIFSFICIESKYS